VPCCDLARSDVPVEVKEAMYGYGKHLGLAFQVVDDVLDYTQTSEQLGKPQVRSLGVQASAEGSSCVFKSLLLKAVAFL